MLGHWWYWVFIEPVILVVGGALGIVVNRWWRRHHPLEPEHSDVNCPNIPDPYEHLEWW